MDKDLSKELSVIEKGIDEIAVTAEKDGEYWRASYSEEDKKCVELLKSWMESLGFSTYTDCVGNLFGRLEGEEDGVVMAGSHRDTVKNDGKYGSGLGIMCALESVYSLYEEMGKPKKTVEVAVLTEQEGSRYSMGIGSRGIAGLLTEEDLDSEDQDGISLRQAMEDSGYFQGELPAPRKDLLHYIELSPEQGSVMLRSQRRAGLVQSICGMLNGRITIYGEQNHAGATPMSMRVDPVVAAARLIVEMTDWAEGRNDRVSVTFGTLEASPGEYNTIADQVTLTIDVRSTYDSLLSEARSILTEFCSDKTDKVDVEFEEHFANDPAEMDLDAIKDMRELSDEHDIDYMRIETGVGHDAQNIAKICPCNMIFVPSEKGIAHSPLEYTSREDFQEGYLLMKEYIRKIAW